jgi:hypothetical protein
MNLFIKVNLCLLCIFCLSELKGQTDFRSGYVINNQNDTIYGLIDYKVATKNMNKCDFKANEKSEIKEFSPTDVKGFRFKDSKYFISKDVIVNGEKIALFLEFLIDGTADLYSFNNGTSPRFFIQKSDGEITELVIKKERLKNETTSVSHEKYEYMSTLKTVLADCPRLFPAIDKTAFETQSLLMVVKRYNDYVSSSKSVFYEKQPPDVKISIAPFISANSSLLSFDRSVLYQALDFKRTNYASIGMQINASLPKSTNTLSFLGTLELGKSHFYGNGIHPLNPMDYEEVNLNIIYLKSKIGLKYTYPKGKFRPNVMIGGNIIRLLEKDGKRVEHATEGSTIIIHQSSENIMNKTLYGFNLDLGVDWHLSSSLIPFASIGFSSSSGNNKGEETRLYVINSTTAITTILKTITFSVGLYF